MNTAASRASEKVRTPAETSAPYSPRECPITMSGSMPYWPSSRAMAVSMLLVNTDPSRILDWTLAVVAAWAATAALLMASPLLLKALGNRGMIAVERLMGMLLVIIAVQMFFEGLQKFLAIQGLAG